MNPEHEPIYFEPEEMRADILVLIRTVRSEIVTARGKLSDIIFACGWKDRLEIPEHGLTLVLQSLHLVMEEIERSRRQPKGAK